MSHHLACRELLALCADSRRQQQMGACPQERDGSVKEHFLLNKLRSDLTA